MLSGFADHSGPKANMNRKNFRRACGTLAVALLALSPRSAAAQQGTVTDIMCPEKAEPLESVEHSYGVNQPSRFVCWYKAPPDAPANLREVPRLLETSGRCQLKHADDIADMRATGSREFTSGRQTCRGDRDRCVVTCRSE
jgi:hypothetical protein